MSQDSKSGIPGTSNRGFASMDPALQREIASKGGRSVPPEERSFSKDRALAAEAGRKGGEASHGGPRGDGQQGTGGTAGRARDGSLATGRDRASDAERKDRSR
jgi:general stress protein YciG